MPQDKHVLHLVESTPLFEGSLADIPYEKALTKYNSVYMGLCAVHPDPPEAFQAAVWEIIKTADFPVYFITLSEDHRLIASWPMLDYLMIETRPHTLECPVSKANFHFSQFAIHKKYLPDFLVMHEIHNVLVKSGLWFEIGNVSYASKRKNGKYYHIRTHLKMVTHGDIPTGFVAYPAPMSELELYEYENFPVMPGIEWYLEKHPELQHDPVLQRILAEHA